MAEAQLPFQHPRHRFHSSDVYFRYRIVFSKSEDLIYLSHIDLIRSLERIFRRADLPVRLAGKFHPMPRIIVALALPLGVHGLREILDVELTVSLNSDSILEQLRGQSPHGLIFDSCVAVSNKVSSRVIRLGYRFFIPSHALEAVRLKLGDLPERGPWEMDRSERRATLSPSSGVLALAEDGLESNNLEEWIGTGSRIKSEPSRSLRRIDLHQVIESIKLSGNYLEAILKFGEGGTAKPEEVLRLVDAESLMSQGERVERFLLEMADDSGPLEPSPLAGTVPAERESK